MKKISYCFLFILVSAGVRGVFYVFEFDMGVCFVCRISVGQRCGKKMQN